ncbi:hypothetical protein [Inediibacterium massiliense]|uniref:hypothetical protein n=1 Tax=Inediibacterium massiliense TaxID=1658111 RepID=UPI0006B4A5DF|nr:hypothetical protein [Inediibacterium massiliense]
MKNKKLISLALTTLMTVGLFSYVAMAIGDPGSQEDPVVTKSYVETRNQQLKEYIDEKIQQVLNIKNDTNSGIVSASSSFEVIEVQKGQKVIAGEGTEMVLRSGQAKAIATSSGGIADLTIGKDLKSGESIPLQHLLLFPRDDGRGIEILWDKTFILVKGTYEIR